MRRPIPHHAPLFLVLALTSVVLSACSGAAAPDGAPDETVGSSSASEATSTPVPEAVGSTATASEDDFPTCDEVKAVLGSVVGGLVEDASTENGVIIDSDGPSLRCSWLTPETVSSSLELNQYGAIGVGIFLGEALLEDDPGGLGWNVEDPTVAAAGAWALKVGGGYAATEQVDPLGVQIVRGDITVAITSGGAMLQDVPQLASLTNEWALSAGVAVLELMD